MLGLHKTSTFLTGSIRNQNILIFEVTQTEEELLLNRGVY